MHDLPMSSYISVVWYWHSLYDYLINNYYVEADGIQIICDFLHDTLQQV